MTDTLDIGRGRPLAGILTAALIAGLIAGLLATALQAIWVWPLIAQAEIYEEAAEHGTTHGAAGHDHGDTPVSPVTRVALSVLTDVAVGVGFALLAAAAMVLAGRRLGWRRGLAWGAAGYAAVMLAPALGLQPVPPGVESGPLEARQIWWIATVLCSAAGLALILLARGRLRFHAIAAGIVLLVLPHLVGAPVGPPEGSAPLALRRQFAVAVLLTSLPVWLLTGGLLGGLLPRYLRAP